MKRRTALNRWTGWRFAVSFAWLFSWAAQTQTEWGSYLLANRFLENDTQAPVFDGAGRLLEGTNYLAMLYGGPTLEALRGVPPELAFGTGGMAGYLPQNGNSVRYVPGVEAGSPGYVQVRAWNARLGPTYEAVAGRGLGGYGESAILWVRSGWRSQEVLPQPLRGLTSFRLRPVVSPVVFAREQGQKVFIDWVGDLPRYQLEQKGRMDEPWVPLGDPVTTNSFILATTNATQFIRVVALPR